MDFEGVQKKITLNAFSPDRLDFREISIVA
jgi:hypothetical protein